MLMLTRFLISGKSVLKLNGDDSYTSLGMYRKPLNCILEKDDFTVYKLSQ